MSWRGFFVYKTQKSIKNANFCKKVLHFYYLCLYLQSQMKGKPIIGVWRSWLAHLVWDQRVLCSSHSTPTKFKSNYLRFKQLLFSFIGMSRYFYLISIVPSTTSTRITESRRTFPSRTDFARRFISSFCMSLFIGRAPYCGSYPLVLI